MPESSNIQDESTSDFLIRTNNRTATLGNSTMVLLQSFITDGDDYFTAKSKVQQLSQEITSNQPGAKTDFILGDTLSLINTVQASILTFMTQAKKDVVINILNQA